MKQINLNDFQISMLGIVSSFNVIVSKYLQHKKKLDGRLIYSGKSSLTTESSDLSTVIG
jgi:hypothetical protein